MKRGYERLYLKKKYYNDKMIFFYVAVWNIFIGLIKLVKLFTFGMKQILVFIYCI